MFSQVRELETFESWPAQLELMCKDLVDIRDETNKTSGEMKAEFEPSLDQVDERRHWRHCRGDQGGCRVSLPCQLGHKVDTKIVTL